MNVGEVNALYQRLIGETDRTFETEAIIKADLGQGYRRMRGTVRSYDAYYYAKQVNISVGGAVYDANVGGGSAVTFYGHDAGPPVVTPTHPTTRILNLFVLGSNGVPVNSLKEIKSIHELEGAPSGYFLTGGKFYFANNKSQTYAVQYEPKFGGWASADLTSEAYIDDLDDFHDLIALYAAEYYYSRVQGSNMKLEQLRMRREQDLAGYMVEAASGEAPLVALHNIWDGI